MMSESQSALWTEKPGSRNKSMIGGLLQWQTLAQKARTGSGVGHGLDSMVRQCLPAETARENFREMAVWQAVANNAIMTEDWKESRWLRWLVADLQTSGAMACGGVRTTHELVVKKKKPMPTHTTCPTGMGFWWVGKSQPTPTLMGTHTCDPYRMPNPWYHQQNQKWYYSKPHIL